MMLPLLLAAQVPPPVVVSSAPPLGALVTWRLGDVRCGGASSTAAKEIAALAEEILRTPGRR